MCDQGAGTRSVETRPLDTGRLVRLSTRKSLVRWGSRRPLAAPSTNGQTHHMQKVSLDALAHQQIALAGSAGGGHTADTVFGGHEKVLRQTVIGMVAGARLAEHNNPGEATVLVLNGHVRLAAADLSWEGHRGDLLIVPTAATAWKRWKTAPSCSPWPRNFASCGHPNGE